MYFNYIIFSYIILLAFEREAILLKGGDSLDKYILNLYQQYCDARKIVFNPKQIEKFTDDFCEWIVENEKLMVKYQEYLFSLDYMYGKTISEVGKGKYDSFKLIDSIIVSPYAETLKIANSELFILGNCPLIKTKQGINVPKTDILFTHNPYAEMMIYNWFKIHNSQSYDISIGVYGSIYDGDFAQKIKMIEILSKQMESDHRVDYDTDKDNYFCTINSKRKTKSRVLVR